MGHASAHKYEDQGGPGLDDRLRVLKGSARHAEDGRGKTGWAESFAVPK